MDLYVSFMAGHYRVNRILFLSGFVQQIIFMEKIVRLIIFIIVCLLFADSGFAHPPAQIEANYNLEEKSLHVKIEHQSKDKEHFVRRVIILVNGKDVESRNFHFQQKNSGIEIDFLLEIAPEDAVIIQAYSSRGGVLEKSFNVSAISPESEGGVSGDSQE